MTVRRAARPRVGGNAEWPVMEFAEVNTALVAGNPYFFEWVPTPVSNVNYVSMNGLVMYNFENEAGPNSYATNFVPDFIEITPGVRQFPYPVVAVTDPTLAFSWRKGFGDPSISLRYSDGVWFGNPTIAPGSTTRYALIGGSNEARDLRRVTLANRTVDGVWIRIVRLNGSTGDLVVQLSDHGTSDSNFLTSNGTLLEEVTVSASSLYETSGVFPAMQHPENFNEVTSTPPFDQAHWLFVPFDQQRTLHVGRAYSLRFRKPSGVGDYGWRTPQGCEHNNPSWSPLSGTWAQHEANHEVPWEDGDSRGIQVSTNGGSSWSFYGGNLRCRGPILYRVVGTS